jgi:hypothetical protein
MIGRSEGHSGPAALTVGVKGNRVGLRIGSTLGRFPAVTRYLEVGDQVLELSRVKRPRQLSAAPEQ